MKAKNCTWDDVLKAVEIINKKYDNNITINFDNDGIKRFTLRPVMSNGPGGKINKFMGKTRRVWACCWHVYGDFFDALFEIAPNAVIIAIGRKITKDGGNWVDYNVGNIINPIMASECCEC